MRSIRRIHRGVRLGTRIGMKMVPADETCSMKDSYRSEASPTGDH